MICDDNRATALLSKSPESIALSEDGKLLQHQEGNKLRSTKVDEIILEDACKVIKLTTESLQILGSKSGVNPLLMELPDKRYDFCCFKQNQPISGTRVPLGKGNDSNYA